MPSRKIDSKLLNSELEFNASRSDGPGGQNVNKVNSKITLRFDVTHSATLTLEEKQLLLTKLANHLTKDGVLVIHAKESRSQLQNKEDVITKLNAIFDKAQATIKPRKKSRPSKTTKEKRIQSKKLNAEKKKWRQKP
ncbi:MAG: alternative ribosome rescue aminoacyl-tRNA hydrolase ArfB [Chryseolinea sp.]